VGSYYNYVSYKYIQSIFIVSSYFIYINRCLLFTAIMTPYRISFYDLDDTTWIVIDSFVDGLFR